MFRLLEHRRRPIDDRVRVDQIRRIELIPTVIALIAARLGVAADRTRPFDVSIGQGVARRGGERAQRGPLDEVAVVVERAEHVLGNCSVIARRRPREAVVADAKIAQVVAGELVVAVSDLTRRDALAIGGHHHRRPMLVGPGHHEDGIALEAVVAGEDVGRHAEARHMPEMARSARVGPCDRDEDPLW